MAMAMVNAFVEKENSIHGDDDGATRRYTNSLVLSVVPLKLKFTLLWGALHPPLPDRRTISNLPLSKNRGNVKRGEGEKTASATKRICSKNPFVV